MAYRMLGSRWRVGRISDWVEGDRQLSSLISVRAERGRGDLRALYLLAQVAVYRGFIV